MERIFGAGDARTIGVLVKQMIFDSTHGMLTSGLDVECAVREGLEEEKKCNENENIKGGRTDHGFAPEGRPRTQETISFGTFLQVIMDYQLHDYLRQLRTFKYDFRQVRTLTEAHNPSFGLGTYQGRWDMAFTRVEFGHATFPGRPEPHLSTQ